MSINMYDIVNASSQEPLWGEAGFLEVEDKLYLWNMASEALLEVDLEYR